jgi:lipopolysaccharide transport system permease protein
MQSPQRPYVRIQASRAFSWTDLRDLWNYRDVLLMLAIQDIKLRDKQTVMGIV